MALALTIVNGYLAISPGSNGHRLNLSEVTRATRCRLIAFNDHTLIALTILVTPKTFSFVLIYRRNGSR